MAGLKRYQLSTILYTAEYNYLILSNESSDSMPRVALSGRSAVGVFGEVAGRVGQRPAAAGSVGPRTRRRVVEPGALPCCPCHLETFERENNNKISMTYRSKYPIISLAALSCILCLNFAMFLSIIILISVPVFNTRYNSNPLVK